MLRLSRSLSVLIFTIQWVDLVLPVPSTGDDRLVHIDFTLDRPSDLLLPQLQYRLLQAQQEQDDLEVIQMQLMQLNLLKLLIILDIIILICVYFYAREERKYQVISL